MNLLCPNCSKMLTVPEQYAGQLMKCPLCSGTFTVPGLPTAPAPAPAPSLAAAPAEPTLAPTLSPTSSPVASEVYHLTPEPEPLADANTFSPVPRPAAAETTAATTPPTAPSLGTEPALGYQRTLSVWFSDRVLQYVAPAAVFLIFVLQFFSWVGIYLGGVPFVTQSAWGAAFASFNPDADIEAKAEGFSPSFKEEVDKPGASALSIFYLLLFLPTLALTIAVPVLTLFPLKLPPFVQNLWPWRWGIVAAVNLIVFFFLVLQLLVGFSLEAKVKEQADKAVAALKAKTTAEIKGADMVYGMITGFAQRTFALKLAVFLHLLAIVSAGMVFWIQQRPNRPLPRLDLMW
jgi:hypothetical protein